MSRIPQLYRQLADEFERLEAPIPPSPQPLPPTGDSEYTLEPFGDLDGKSFPVNTPINFNFTLRKNGSPAQREVVRITTPYGVQQVVTNENGSAGVTRVQVPQGEGGMIIKAEAHGLTAQIRIHDSGGVVFTPAPSPSEIPAPPKPSGDKGYAPFQTSGDYQVLVNFYDKNFGWIGEAVDVCVNGRWYNFFGRGMNDSIWDQRLGNSRGKVIYLNEPIRRVEFDLAQIVRGGEKENFGFGFFNYKIGASDQDLRNQRGVPGQNYIFDWYNGMAIQRYRHGENGRTFDNPEFHKFPVPASWNETKKLKILIARWEGR